MREVTRKNVSYFFAPLILTGVFMLAIPAGVDTAWFFLWVLAFGCWIIATYDRWA